MCFIWPTFRSLWSLVLEGNSARSYRLPLEVERPLPCGRDRQALYRDWFDQREADFIDVVLQIRNGPGQVIGQGAVKLVRAEVTLSLLLPEFDARRLSLVVLDYIRGWKQAHFADLAVPRTAPCEEARAQASAPEHTPLSAAAHTAHGPAILSRPDAPERPRAPSRNGPEQPTPRRHRSSGQAATDSQVAFLLDLAAEFGHRGERGRLWLAEQGGETPVERLTRAQASALIERLLGMRQQAVSRSSP